MDNCNEHILKELSSTKSLGSWQSFVGGGGHVGLGYRLLSFCRKSDNNVSKKWEMFLLVTVRGLIKGAHFGTKNGGKNVFYNSLRRNSQNKSDT